MGSDHIWRKWVFQCLERWDTRDFLNLENWFGNLRSFELVQNKSSSQRS